MTIISDQDKGSTGAVKEIFKEAFHFHCSWHCLQNITTKFGNKDGTAELSANWMFNVLSNCKTHRAIKMKGDTYFHGMTANERNYLRKLPDSVQYPAACCAMGADVCMYGRSASSCVESMNRAGSKEPHCYAMRMVRIEARWFESYKELAWSQTLPLTPRGMDEMEAVFSELNTVHYNRDIHAKWLASLLHTRLLFPNMLAWDLSSALAIVEFPNVTEFPASTWRCWLTEAIYRTHNLPG